MSETPEERIERRLYMLTDDGKRILSVKDYIDLKTAARFARNVLADTDLGQRVRALLERLDAEDKEWNPWLGDPGSSPMPQLPYDRDPGADSPNWWK
jgi:hypothetical protein